MSAKQKTADQPPASRRSKAKTRSVKQRRPHNAKWEKEWNTLDELVALVGSEARQVTLGGEVVTMTRAERRLRDEVDKALKGEVRALKLILSLMIKYPTVVQKPGRIVTILHGALARL